MLIIALVLGTVLYIALYFAWSMLQQEVSAPSSLFDYLRELVFRVPEATGLALLKWSLILIAFYLLSENLLSALKRRNRGKTRS
jgi:hypothetical protein